MPRRREPVRIAVEDARTACELAAPGTDAFLDGLVVLSDLLVPNPPMDIVEWAFEFMDIPPSVSPERPGPLEFSPPQAAIIRLTQSPTLKQVSFKKPPRWGSSLKSLAILFYYAFWEGRSVIYYERSDEAAQQFHDKFISPVIENSPKLAKLVRPRTKAGVQDSWSDIYLLNGAVIQLRSASNNGHMRSIKGNPVIGDEVSSKEWKDRSKHSEGSKVRLLRTRLQQSANPMLYVGSTPTNPTDCTISQEYEVSDRRVYRMPCPRCTVPIVFEATASSFVQVESRGARRGPGLRYRKDEDGRVVDAWYECGECGGAIEPTEKLDMLAAGGFVVTNPLGEDDHAGVHVNALYSTDPQCEWLSLAKEHATVLTNPAELMPGFVNHVCALVYDPAPERIVDPSSLSARKQTWLKKDGTRAQGPEWAVMLEAGVDVQRGSATDSTKPPRFEVTVVATGPNRQRAVIKHQIISHYEMKNSRGETEYVSAAPFTTDASDLLWAFLDQEWEMADGRKLRIRRTFVDTSFDHDPAVRFCSLPRSKALGIVAIKGSSIERNGQRVNILPPNLRMPKGREKGNRWLTIGTQSAKDLLSRLLKIPAGMPDSYVFADDLPDEYFRGLTAEYPDEIRPGAWHWTRISETNTGEPWDCLLYAYVAERYEIVKAGRKSRLATTIDTVDPELREAALAAQAEKQATARAKDAAPADGPEPSPVSVQTETAAVQPVPEPTSRFRVVERKKRQEPERDANGESLRVKRVRERRTGIGW